MVAPLANVPGIDFDFGGGRIFTIPPLSLNAFKALQQRGDISKVELTEKSIDACMAAVHAALRRNYPEITIDQVGELVDLSNLHEVMQCVLDVAGLKRKKVREAAAEGNVPGAAD